MISYTQYMAKIKNNLLLITQKIHSKDDDLAFVILWIDEFVKQGFNVTVICLEKGDFSDSFPVYSLGKERGNGRILRALIFLKHIFTLRYDKVFIHMNPEYFTLGGWYWKLRNIPSYLWYTHYKNHIHLKIAFLMARRIFAATDQSLPQYKTSQKRIITGHGIDISFWRNAATEVGPSRDEFQLLVVSRVCRSKRIDICLKALLCLDTRYRLTVYGRPVEKDYYEELIDFVKKEGLQHRVRFAGPVPMSELKNIYGNYGLFLNMAYETIDKTMLEAMIFGLYPVTTKANSIAIGLPIYPEDDKPETLAEFIRQKKWKSLSKDSLCSIVEEKHSLSALISKMREYIITGK